MASLDGSIDSDELTEIEKILKNSKEGQRQINNKDFDRSVGKGIDLFQKLSQDSVSAVLQESVRQLGNLRDSCTVEYRTELIDLLADVARADDDFNAKEFTFSKFAALYALGVNETKTFKRTFNKLNKGFAGHEYNMAEAIRLSKLIEESHENIKFVNDELATLQRMTFKDFGLDNPPEITGFKEMNSRKTVVIALAFIPIPLGIYYYIKMRKSKKTDISYWNNIDYLQHLKQTARSEIAFPKKVDKIKSIIVNYSTRMENLQTEIEHFLGHSNDDPFKEKFPSEKQTDSNYDNWLLLELLSYVPGVA
jgi:hypothetical protein